MLRELVVPSVGRTYAENMAVHLECRDRLVAWLLAVSRSSWKSVSRRTCTYLEYILEKAVPDQYED